MNAYDMLMEFPNQFEQQQVKKVNISDYKGVVFSGMGGSGIVGDIIKLLLENSQIGIPVLSVKGYSLPFYVGQGWLVICTSYSGDTEETLSVFDNALSVKASIICVSSGGSLKSKAEAEGIEYYSIPQGYPPRYALGYMLSTLMCLFGFDPTPIRQNLLNNREEIMNLAEKFSQLTYGYVPIVYGTPLTEPVAFRWKTQINENAKTQCYNAILPELHHNEVVGLDNPTIRNLCYFFLLYDPQDHPRVIKRVEITQNILKEFGIAPVTLNGKGKTLAERIMYFVYLGDWLSYYLAQAYGYDPIPVKVVQWIKKELSDK